MAAPTGCLVQRYTWPHCQKRDHAGKTLETWLREKFFTRPASCSSIVLIWHIWDGLRDASALVNYHSSTPSAGNPVLTYLAMIFRPDADIASLEDGAPGTLPAAEALKEKAGVILEGEAPTTSRALETTRKSAHRWDRISTTAVRLNIAPSSRADVGKRGAGVLRDKPNINWNKDRGKDVESAPWYHVFDGDRINDHHLTLAEKRAAREAAE